MSQSKLLKIGALRALQRGTSLLEIMGALVIGSLVTVGVINQTSSYVDDLKDANTADHLRAYGQAAKTYVQTNKDRLLMMATSGVSSVQGKVLAEYLPSGFGNVITNPYGHTPCLLVKKVGDKELKAMLFTEQPDNTARYKIDPARQKFISVMAGLGAGYVETGASGTDAKGPGWKDRLSDWPGSCGGQRTNSSLALSLDLYQPDREQDCRYLSVDTPQQPGCGEMMKRDLVFEKGAAIRNLSEIYPSGTLRVKGATNFDSSVGTAGNLSTSGTLSVRGTSGAGTVVIGGSIVTGDADKNLSIDAKNMRLAGRFSAGDSIVSELYAKIGESCERYPTGAMARSSQFTSPSGVTTSEGVILSCQQKTPGSPKLWQNMVAEAGEEIGAIIGCNWHNNYCKWDWSTARANSGSFFDRLAAHIASLGTSCPSGSCLRNLVQRDSVGNTRHGWEIEIGERTFCSLGFYAIGSSVSNDIPSGALAVDQSIGACRVVTTGVRHGRPVWALRAIVSTDQNVPAGSRDRGTVQVSCHAVCIK